MRNLRAQFEEFDAANPAVWRLFCRFADEAIAAGHEHMSSDQLVHRIRWETDIVTRGAGEVDGRKLRLNNNATAFFARKWLALHPERPDFFRTRSSAADQPVFQLESEPVHA